MQLAVEQDALIYESLATPANRIERFSVRRRHGVSDAELHATAWALIEGFETIAMLSLPDLELFVRDAAPGNETAGPLEDDIAFGATLLSVARRARSAISGPAGGQLARALEIRDPAVFKEYETHRARALARLDDLERLMVLYGAGSDEDAELAMGIIPPAPSGVPPAPSQDFEF